MKKSKTPYEVFKEDFWKVKDKEDYPLDRRIVTPNSIDTRLTKFLNKKLKIK